MLCYYVFGAAIMGHMPGVNFNNAYKTPTGTTITCPKGAVEPLQGAPNGPLALPKPVFLAYFKGSTPVGEMSLIGHDW